MQDPDRSHHSRAEHGAPSSSHSSHASHASHQEDAPGGRHGRESPRGLALDAPGPNPSHPPEIPEELLDADAVKVIARLRHMGHQAYFVGGCVRDALLGRTPKDFDVATSAHPGEVRAVFRNCRLIGRRFRLAHVHFRGGKVIEVATFRTTPVGAAEDLGEEADLLITRDNVFGTDEEDARRRDFTVNGLFYDVFAGEVLDYVGGRADLEAHRIATIGDPEVRMREDPVRALRAVRFAARLGFTIEPETFAAMRHHAPELGRCAAPRLLEEIFKILRCGASARAFELLRSSGALSVLLPALSAFFDGADEAGRRRFLAHLTALDALVRRADDPSEAVLLGALLLHLPAGENGAPGERDRLLAELVLTARLPRRVAERTRLALAAQRTLEAPPKRRRRATSTQGYFEDALQLLEITVEATGQGAELLERWQSGAGGQGGRDRVAGHDQDAERYRDPGRDHGPARDHLRAARGVERGRAEPQKVQEIEVTAGDEGEHAPRARHPSAAAGVGAAATPPDGEGGARKRRRRRGGRRRRRRGGAQPSPASP